MAVARRILLLPQQEPAPGSARKAAARPSEGTGVRAKAYARHHQRSLHSREFALVLCRTRQTATGSRPQRDARPPEAGKHDPLSPLARHVDEKQLGPVGGLAFAKILPGSWGCSSRRHVRRHPRALLRLAQRQKRHVEKLENGKKATPVTTSPFTKA